MQIAERSRSAMRNVLVAGIAAWTLAGCAGFSQDGGFGTVEEAARQHLGRTVIRGNSEAARGRIAAEVDQLLKQPLGADEAVQLALLNNRGLQASFADRKSTRLNSSHSQQSRMPSSA